MKKKKIIDIQIILFIILLLTSCSKSSNINIIDNPIYDNKEVYSNDSLSEIKEVYITVIKPTKNDPKYNFTLSQLNATATDDTLKYDPEVKVIFQEGKNGVIKKDNYGFGLSDYNATMELRGQSARIAELKSYKVNLNPKTPWNNFVTVNLNKHPFDDLLIRNKLAFELIKNIDNITSARTQFVHLFIKDFSEGNYSNPYVDYGLFTQIENIDLRYLENHNLDVGGYLYKIENFEFKRYEDIIKNVDDPNYRKKDFEDILEIKGVENHQKLITMLEAVNNDFININDVVEQFFDRENLLTWLALNIITDNVDTQSRNYFLYSPQNLNTWYFLPWDYDKALGGYEDLRPIWQRGVSNFWGNILINRFIQNDKNRNDLTNKIEELNNIINQKKIDNLINLYKPISKEYLNRAPDKFIENLSDDEIEMEFNKLKNSIKTNINEYYKSLERPMPVFLLTPYKTGNFMEFDWSESYDFQGDQIYYSFELSDSPTFDKIIYKKDNIITNQLIIKTIPAGHYFYRVYITDSKGNRSDAFDIYYDEDTLLYSYGVKDFYIN